MAAVNSNMLELNTQMPEFNLIDTISSNYIDSKTLNKKATVIMFICNHCPFVLHINEALVKLGEDYENKDVDIIAISSNDVKNYPDDSPEKMKENALNLGYKFPYLYDETQEVAKSFMAACTPDFYLFNSDKKLVYRGQFDNSRPSNTEKVDGKDLRNAIEAVLNNTNPDKNQIPSIGCNIKWK